MSEPVVFLPGMMCDARLFTPQLAMISAHRAVMVAPMRGDRIEEIASNVISAAPPRFALAGLSMGGIVAMEILRRAPDRVTRLCLMDTNPLAETPQKAAEREPQIVRVKAGRLEEVMRDEMKPAYLAPGPGRLEIMQQVARMARDLGPDLFVQQSRALMRRKDQQGTLRRVKCPTMVICGAHDQLCPPKRHEMMAALIEGARLTIIDEAGHLPTLEQPEQVNDLLRAWLGMPLVLR